MFIPSRARNVAGELVKAVIQYSFSGRRDVARPVMRWIPEPIMTYSSQCKSRSRRRRKRRSRSRRREEVVVEEEGEGKED